MKDKVYKMLSTLVEVNYYTYLAVGFVVEITCHFLFTQSLINKNWFLVNVTPPTIFSSLLVGFFCRIFYQKKYDDFDFQKIDHRRHIGIPREDFFFYSVISKKDLNNTRMIAGYIYALSKPLIFIMLGVSLATLLFVMYFRDLIG